MRVSVMNLGDGARVFFNRIGKAVHIPVGGIVTTDLASNLVQSLRFPSRPETVFVCDHRTKELPPELKAITNLIQRLEFDNQDDLLREFFKLAPPASMTDMRPSRAQMRVVLRTMVEDWIDLHRDDPIEEVKDIEDAPPLDDEQPRRTRRRKTNGV